MKKALTILMGLAVVLGSFGFSSCNQKEEGKKQKALFRSGRFRIWKGIVRFTILSPRTK